MNIGTTVPSFPVKIETITTLKSGDMKEIPVTLSINHADGDSLTDLIKEKKQEIAECIPAESKDVLNESKKRGNTN